MESTDSSMVGAPPGMVAISDVAVAAERYLGIPRYRAAAILRPAIERGEIRYEIWGTDADRKDAPWEARAPLAGPYALPADVNSFGGWGMVDLSAGTIEGREIRVDWLDLCRFVNFNRDLFDLPALTARSGDHGETRAPMRSLSSSEQQCQAWLQEEMSTSQNTTRTNEALLHEALSRFSGLSKVAFARAKKAAIKATGATGWRKAGRKKRANL